MLSRIAFALMIVLATACSSASSGSPAAGGGGPEVTTPAGLKYTDEVVGTGKQPQVGQTAIVHYTGWTLDGKKFDSSKDKNQPFQFPRGAGRVIKGWDEGVATMKVGGKRILVAPPELGYGPRGFPPETPPNAPPKF